MASESRVWLADFFRICLPRTRQHATSHSPTSSTYEAPLPNEIVSAQVTPSPAIPLLPVAKSVSQEPEHDTAVSALREILAALTPSLSGLPPLQLAVGGLLECIVHLQVEEQNRQAYEEIMLDLTSLATLLQKHAVGPHPRNVPYSIANVARAVSEQTKYIKEQQDRTRLSRLAMAKDDEEAADISLSTWDEIREQQMKAQLKDLLPAHEAHYDAALSVTVTKRVGCTKNTRVQILENAWTWVCENNATKIYWMNGMAGTGKTTIAYTLCEMLHEAKQLGVSFFCSRNSPDCRDVNKIVPTIAYQLGCYSNPYRQALCDVLDDDPDIAKRSVSTQFKQLITKPLKKIGQAMPKDVIVVIDALDECADIGGTKSILEMLIQYSSDLPIKFFVTSRPEPAISDSMAVHDGASRSILRLHDIEQTLVQADIKTYLTDALKSVQISEPDLDRLAALAGKLFIFAATAVRYIAMNHNAIDSQERLQNILGGYDGDGDKQYKELDSLYRTILGKALDEEELDRKEVERRRRVLWTVVCAQASLAPSTLSELLTIGTEQQVLLAIQSLQSVLHTSDSTGTVTVLHASFPDFLLNRDRSRVFFCDPTNHHSYLAACCFDHMERRLRFNICELETSYQLDREVPDLDTRVKQIISPGLFYACQYWPDHLVAVQSSTETLRFLDRFLKHHLLFWMEVLSLKQWSKYGEGMLSKVVDWLSIANLTDLRDFAHDARNFVTSFAANSCSSSTPHIYLSVLPFTSQQNHVRKTYWPRTKGLLQVEGAGMEARGKSALAIWAVGNDVNSLALSKDGKHVVSGSDNNEVSVWDVSSGARILGPLEGHKERVWSVAYSPDNTRIASGSEDRTIRIWHAQTGDLIAGPPESHSDAVRSVAFSPDGAHLASGSEDATIRIWDGYSGAPVGEPLEGHQGAVRSIAFSPDGQHLVSRSGDKTIRVWNWQEGATPPGLLEGHTDAVYSVAYSSDGLHLASGSKDRTVRVWDMSNRTLLAGPFEDHTDTVSSVAFSPNGTRVVSGSYDKTIRVWEAVSGTLVAGPFEGHGGAIQSVLFTADGTRILSGSDDDTIRVWDARHGTTDAAESSGHTGGIKSVALSPDGTRVASGSADKTICVWDMHSGALVAGPFTGHTREVRSVAFSPDGARIVSGSYDSTLRTWDASTGATLVCPIEGHTSSVESVAFSPDGSKIASGSDDRTIRLWNSHTGASVAQPFRGHTHYVMSIAFSPDSARILSGSFDDTVRMWDASDGTMLWTSDAHAGDVNCVAFSPDGTRVVSGSDDKTILVLDAADGAVLHGPFTGHTNWVLSVAFSPNGTRVVSGSVDQTVRVWDVESGTTVAGPLKGHREEVNSVAFSLDGARIISGSADYTIRVWDLAAVEQANPSGDWFIDGDGWLTNSHSQRLFWVPSDLRRAFWFTTPSNPIVMNSDCTTRVDPSVVLGDWWHGCYGV